MSKAPKKNRIKKVDYSRVLTTETTPYETPIIFSNDGLRNYVHSHETLGSVLENLVTHLVLDNKFDARLTVPFHYKIKKSSTDLRRLSLLHPASQWNIATFYKKYERLILHFCSISPITIRAPSKIAGTYFTKSGWENINQFKSSAVNLLETDQYSRHSPSFFAYRGHDRLYKFFESPDYLALEKKFSVLQTLDVSKCFDSIYTHCLSWATKDKEFTKKYVAIASTFAQDFDLTLRQANHGETNGIAIGPEVSRIFAEIIFQRIDVNVVARLSNLPKSLGIDYEIRRYVDDVFIFSNDEGFSQRIYEFYSDALLAFNLHVNAAKSSVTRRPFVTKKSRITTEVTNIATQFFDKFLDEIGDGVLAPKKIHKRFGLAKSFLDGVKATCSANDASYDDISSYLVSVVTERVKKLVNVTRELEPGDVQESYRDAAMVLLEVQYFLYVVSPSVSASYKLCTSIVLICRFFSAYVPDFEETIKQWIYELSEPLFSNEPNSDWSLIDGMISLELINVLLALRELGDKYLLPVKALDSLFDQNKNFSYFDLVCCLFYVRNESKYKSIRIRINKLVDRKLASFHDINSNSEKAHLFLDALACPYIHNRSKRKWLARFFKAFSLPQPSAVDLTVFLTDPDSMWFIDWKHLDLLNSLEKKELKRAY